MTTDDIWEAYCARNPKLRHPAESITLSAAKLRQLINEVYAVGQHVGVPPPRAAFTERDDAVESLFRSFRSKRPRD